MALVRVHVISDAPDFNAQMFKNEDGTWLNGLPIGETPSRIQFFGEIRIIWIRLKARVKLRIQQRVQVPDIIGDDENSFPGIF